LVSAGLIVQVRTIALLVIIDHIIAAVGAAGGIKLAG
jgi:hypothetical protein